MARQLSGEAGGGMGHLRVTIGFLRVTVGHLRLPVGYLKATLVHIRVTLGHLNSLLPRIDFSKLCRYIDSPAVES